MISWQLRFTIRELDDIGSTDIRWCFIVGKFFRQRRSLSIHSFTKMLIDISIQGSCDPAAHQYLNEVLGNISTIRAHHISLIYQAYVMTLKSSLYDQMWLSTMLCGYGVESSRNYFQSSIWYSFSTFARGGLNVYNIINLIIFFLKSSFVFNFMLIDVENCAVIISNMAVRYSPPVCWISDLSHCLRCEHMLIEVKCQQQ